MSVDPHAFLELTLSRLVFLEQRLRLELRGGVSKGGHAETVAVVRAKIDDDGLRLPRGKIICVLRATCLLRLAGTRAAHLLVNQRDTVCAVVSPVGPQSPARLRAHAHVGIERAADEVSVGIFVAEEHG